MLSVPLLLLIQAEEGYIISSNLNVLVNGETLESWGEGFLLFEFCYLEIKTDILCDHVYSDWTATADGYMKACSKCNDVVLEEHEYVDDQDTTCDICDYERELADSDKDSEKVPNPEKGLGITMAVMILLIAVCCMLFILKRRRYN